MSCISQASRREWSFSSARSLVMVMVFFLFLVALFAYILDISAWWLCVQVIIGRTVCDYPYVGVGGIFKALCARISD